MVMLIVDQRLSKLALLPWSIWRTCGPHPSVGNAHALVSGQEIYQVGMILLHEPQAVYTKVFIAELFVNSKNL
jgi:hypothetical protein